MKKKHRLIEFVIDPSSKDLSLSRVGLGIIIIIDAIWLTCCVFGLPPQMAYVPISAMLGACTMSIAGVYGANSFGGSLARGFSSMAGMIPIRGPKPKQEEGER